MKEVKALVLTGYGLNCDIETAFALEKAGAVAHRVHINSLIDRSVNLSDFNLLVFGGGFSWGDDHGAGVIQAVRMKTHIGDQIREFIARGNLVMGICNGFQTVVNMGLLPAFETGSANGTGASSQRQVALISNDCGNFRDQWIHLKTEADSPCVFTRGIDRLDLPVRHGEGKFFAPQEILDRLRRSGQVVMRYAAPDGRAAGGQFPHNPNGSLDDIAGVCDPSGRVFGLMPHPEAFNHWTNHPDWTRLKEIQKRRGEPVGMDSTPGIRIFENAVAYLSQKAG